MSLLFEIAGKIEDLSKKYPNLDIREIASNDPSNTKKYLSWIENYIISDELKNKIRFEFDDWVD